MGYETASKQVREQHEPLPDYPTRLMTCHASPDDSLLGRRGQGPIHSITTKDMSSANRLSPAHSASASIERVTSCATGVSARETTSEWNRSSPNSLPSEDRACSRKPSEYRKNRSPGWSWRATS